MPTVLDLMGKPSPGYVEGATLLPKVYDHSQPGRDFAVSTVPFANPGDAVDSVDNVRRNLGMAPVTTVTTDEWSLLYSIDEGMSQLYHLPSDPRQKVDAIGSNPDIARSVHERLVKFMSDTNLPDTLRKPRTELRL